ncbi:TetR/AcrR family transcriptional regulator [Cocleimonas sp. KMM 6892]|uniref:TetR/AcrR family transcriptional regulator n=1 Tax=unclassified Cocleimonas TaxID=2639732 RepID=UPI002DBB648B|nr:MULTISPECIES: TetR/AcrR family transcriptional regulator [unclassified Cocleimonas]MEB8433069.1 TetR/AcrR family transcriptional regulator [Cocleimonas sp. KMM 6892]MEC4715950.1 TetR/AcrR family transcriptional regulator [Cocleimonas sp. KMM 6895]MEC4745411.1 TetR/AcrR family transcriptional regulator [Cocleimonas sp. KMM 6896]
MPLSKQHKQTSHDKILSSAITLFSTKGFDQVSIDELMNHAGLTRGAFYAHFESKQAVYAKAVVAGAKRTEISRVKPDDFDDQQWIKYLVNDYLSLEHINQEHSPCPLAFLVTDIANSESEVKEAYTKVFRGLNAAMHKRISKVTEDTKKPEVSKEDIYAATAMMIGSVAIGRALNDESLTSDLLNSSRQSVFELLKL